MTPDARLARHQRLVAADRRHLWHPFTQMQEWLDEEPVVIDSAEGMFLVDTLGRRYLDGVSSLWCNVHGHQVPELDRAVKEQLDRVAHTTLLGLASTASIECAVELAQVLPAGVTRVFFSDSGSTAVEVALKMAYQHHQLRGDTARTEFVALSGAYHGDTVGSVSLGGIDLFHQLFRPLLFPVNHAPEPYCYRCPLSKRPETCAMECADAVEAVFEQKKGRVAALVVEPVMQGAAGMIAQPKGYLRRMREICDRHGALLVCDEVATGFGRTGTTFAVEQEGVTPDLLAVAKGITGGYLPLAATCTTERVFESFLGPFASKRTFFHGHTYTGNPLACAAATASLRLMRQTRLVEGVAAKAERLAAALSPLRDHPHVGEIRQRGLMVGIELVRDRATREEYAYELRAGHRVILEARTRGAILRPLGNVVVLMPPLAMEEAELAELAAITTASIDAATRAL
jgi:adenosylmethionine---8-amino-7-oxononanoate aminotransferase